MIQDSRTGITNTTFGEFTGEYGAELQTGNVPYSIPPDGEIKIENGVAASRAHGDHAVRADRAAGPTPAAGWPIDLRARHRRRLPVVHRRRHRRAPAAQGIATISTDQSHGPATPA